MDTILSQITSVGFMFREAFKITFTVLKFSFSFFYTLVWTHKCIITHMLLVKIKVKDTVQLIATGAFKNQ